MLGLTFKKQILNLNFELAIKQREKKYLDPCFEKSNSTEDQYFHHSVRFHKMQNTLCGSNITQHKSSLFSFHIWISPKMCTLLAHIWLIKHVQYCNLKYAQVQQLSLVLHSLWAPLPKTTVSNVCIYAWISEPLQALFYPLEHCLTSLRRSLSSPSLGVTRILQRKQRFKLHFFL